MQLCQKLVPNMLDASPEEYDAAIKRLTEALGRPSSSNSQQVDDVTLQGQYVRELEARVAKLKGIEKDLSTALEDAQRNCDFAEQLARLVEAYLADGVCEHVREMVVACPPQMERVKAFRMVREKVKQQEQQQQQKDVDASIEVAPISAVGKALDELRVLLWDSKGLDGVQAGGQQVVGCALRCVELARSMRGEQLQKQVLTGCYLLLKERFSSEPRIPLYICLYHNSLMLLQQIGQDAMMGDEAGRVYLQWLNTVEEDLAANFVDIALKDYVQAVKRCVHQIRVLSRTLTDVVSESMLQNFVSRCVDVVLDRGIVASVLKMDDLSSDESDAICKAIDAILPMCLEALELSPSSSEADRRAAVSSWPRARKMKELLSCSLAEVDENLPKFSSIFSSKELTKLVCAAFEDTTNRRKFLEKLNQ